MSEFLIKIKPKLTWTRSQKSKCKRAYRKSANFKREDVAMDSSIGLEASDRRFCRRRFYHNHDKKIRCHLRTCDIINYRHKLTIINKGGGNNLNKFLSFPLYICTVLLLICLTDNLSVLTGLDHQHIGVAKASLIIGDSAIEIQEVDNTNSQTNNDQKDSAAAAQQLDEQQQQHQQDSLVAEEQPSIILGSTNGLNVVPDTSINLDGQPPTTGELGEIQDLQNFEHKTTRPTITTAHNANNQHTKKQQQRTLPPPLMDTTSGDIKEREEDVTDGDIGSRDNHDFNIDDLKHHDSDEKQLDRAALSQVFSARPLDKSRKDQAFRVKNDNDSGGVSDKSITGKVVDFELESAGGHNKAKIKKKEKKKKKKEEEMFKKWDKKKKSEKMAEEKKHKEEMKKKKEEGKKGKKKWGHEEHGQKKKGNYKKKKWGKKVKKGKGVKKGKKGKKFLMDKGHKNTGFKTVYHKEEWGKSSKWHDIKREKKWDEKSKKWKKKWKKEKGKKYKGDHMKKFENKKKSGKKYKKENKDKFKKFKKEEFKKGKKKKMEEHKKKKENGAKKEMEEFKKKKKKKKE